MVGGDENLLLFVVGWELNADEPIRTVRLLLLEIDAFVGLPCGMGRSGDPISRPFPVTTSVFEMSLAEQSLDRCFKIPVACDDVPNEHRIPIMMQFLCGGIAQPVGAFIIIVFDVLIQNVGRFDKEMGIILIVKKKIA